MKEAVSQDLEAHLLIGVLYYTNLIEVRLSSNVYLDLPMGVQNHIFWFALHNRRALIKGIKSSTSKRFYDCCIFVITQTFKKL